MKIKYQIHFPFFCVLLLLCCSISSSAQKKKHTEKKHEEKKQTEVKKKDKEDTDTKAPEKKQPEERAMGVCNCVLLKIQAQDTLSDDAYITYTFTVKNRCKEPVWVNSSHFGFNVNNFGGGRPRVIRELQFVKRFIYPPFVLINPNSDFEFKFADNPFDEYQLKRGNRYWFRFTYNNPGSRHPSGKHLNYICKKELQRLVYIR